MEAADPSRQSTNQNRYDARFGSALYSAVRLRIRQEVYGQDYPEEAEPRSFVTLAELRRIAAELRVGREHTFVDLGCGHGGPGLWVARETGAAVVGLDLSPAALASAPERAQAFGITDRARFQIADITATGVADEHFDGAMSIDTLWAVPDKASALRECARILKRGARFAFTNWDRDLSPPGLPPPLGDHRPLLEAAGFEVEVYEVQPEAEERRRAFYQRMVAAEEELTRELGEEGARRALFEPKATLGSVDGTDYLAHSRRIFVVARRP
jgi:ubiquinone/menaquinone biosynthesis C-methylase UbiE